MSFSSATVEVDGSLRRSSDSSVLSSAVLSKINGLSEEKVLGFLKIMPPKPAVTTRREMETPTRVACANGKDSWPFLLIKSRASQLLSCSVNVNPEKTVRNKTASTP